MAWISEGSVSDRLKALDFQDSLILKNDPMAASMEQQVPMNTPGPNGVVPQEFKGAGLKQGSPLSMALNGLKEAFRTTDTGVASVRSILAQYGNEGVMQSTYLPLLDALDQYHDMMKQMEASVTAMIQNAKTQALMNNNPADSVGPQGNADMANLMGGGMGGNF